MGVPPSVDRAEPVLLGLLLRARQWHRYGIFRVEYDKAALMVDRDLVGTAPSRAQLHRWVSGELRRLPYVDHCRVLEAMFPGHTAEQLFGLAPPPAIDPKPIGGGSHADVAAVFTSRSDFMSHLPAHRLFQGARTIRAAGLSLNLVCQSYPDHDLQRLVERGGELHCLFLEPHGTAIRARETEEGYPPGHLSALTDLNLQLLRRLRDRLPASARDRVTLATYDETIRFNILLVDGPNGRMGVIQPYLPHARGVDAPTLFLHPDSKEEDGLFPVFERVFGDIDQRSRPT